MIANPSNIQPTPPAPGKQDLVSGSGSFTASWTAPTGVPVTGYRLRYSTNPNMSGAVTINTGIIVTARVVSGLTNGVTYYVTVATTNRVGTGDAVRLGSVVVSATSAPTSFVTYPSKTGSVVAWVAPMPAAGSRITGYRITYSTTKDMTSATTITTTAPRPTVTLSGLTPGTVYFYRVATITTFAVGQPSSMNVVKTRS